MPDTLCLYSTLKNVSGVEQFFGFLPPHGKTLANNGCVTIFGDIWDRLATFGGGRLNERARDAFEDAVTNSTIEIIKSPSLFIYDDTATRVRIVDVDGGTLGVLDPCYGSYIGPGCS